MGVRRNKHGKERRIREQILSKKYHSISKNREKKVMVGSGSI